MDVQRDASNLYTLPAGVVSASRARGYLGAAEKVRQADRSLSTSAPYIGKFIGALSTA